MALRTEIPFIVQTGTGDVVQGASVQVNNRTGGAGVVYAAETGVAPLPNPITTGTSGRIDGWLEEGQYNLVISGPGITTYTQAWDVRSGGVTTRAGSASIGNVGPASQGGLALGTDPGDIILYRSAAATARLNGAAIIDGTASIGQAKLVGTALSLALQDSSSNGIFKASYAAAFTDNTNIQRLEVGNNITNNDGVVSGLTGVALRRFAIAAQGFVLGNLASSALPIPTTDSLRIEYAGGRDTLNLTSTGVDTGITIGGDVEVYRSAADVLKSPDTFDAGAFRQGGVALASTHLSDAANVGLINAAKTWSAIQTYSADGIYAGGDVRVRAAGDTFDKVRLGWDGLIYFGSGALAYDVTLRRSAVGLLRSSGGFEAIGGITANIGATNQVTLDATAARILFGLAGDTNLYRSAADTLKTDDALHSGGIGISNAGGAGQVQTGAVGPAGAAGIALNDATIHRSAAGMVTITNDLTVRNLTVTGTQTVSSTQTSVGSLTAAVGNSGQVRIGNVGGEGTIYFGTAEDTSLARDGANQLRTTDALRVDGLFTATIGATVSGGVLRTDRALATDEAFALQTAGTNRLRGLANGTLEWAAPDGVGDASAQLVRSVAGIITASGTLNANSGYQVNGVALASTHLSDSAALARLASPTFTGTVTAPVMAATTRHEVPSGTAAAPSRTFAGDPDSGFFSPGADQIAISTAGVSRFTIGATGIVNISGSLTIAGTGIVLTDDARLTNARTPSGSASGELSGTYPGPTIASGVITNTHVAAGAAIVDTKLATISTVGKVADSAVAATIARLASPSFTGVPTTPTAAVDTNNTQIATTAFVLGQAASVAPLPNGAVAVGTSLRYSRQDHIHPGDTNRAPLDSPTFTGIPAAPTAASGNNTTQLATTAFVTQALGGSSGASFSSLTLTNPGLTTLNLTNIGAGITIGDVNWYRSAADVMKTDDSLHVTANFRHLGTNLGFYGAAQVARQARPTTIAEIITVLANLGLTL